MSSPASPRAGRRRRLVVVDNDAIMRAGTQAVLSASDEIELVAAIDHDTAVTWTDQWSSVDVAIVDASDQRRAGDQFPGVDVVRRIRSSGADVLAIVLTGQYLHPGLRRRMWEAGADFFYARDDGMTEEELISVVLSPAEHRRMRHVPHALPEDLGVTTATRVNELIDRLFAGEAHHALEPELRKKVDPHGERSRWWNHVRSLASGPDGLTPVKASGASALDLDSPSVVQLRKFFSAMTRADRRQPR